MERIQGMLSGVVTEMKQSIKSSTKEANDANAQLRADLEARVEMLDHEMSKVHDRESNIVQVQQDKDNYQQF